MFFVSRHLAMLTLMSLMCLLADEAQAGGPLTRCWALDLAPDRVNAVAAGPTKTDFLTEQVNPSAEQAEAVTAEECSRIPLVRGVPEDVATWIVLLVSLSGAWITHKCSPSMAVSISPEDGLLNTCWVSFALNSRVVGHPEVDLCWPSVSRPSRTGGNCCHRKVCP